MRVAAAAALAPACVGCVFRFVEDVVLILVCLEVGRGLMMPCVACPYICVCIHIKHTHIKRPRARTGVGEEGSPEEGEHEVVGVVEEEGALVLGDLGEVAAVEDPDLCVCVCVVGGDDFVCVCVFIFWGGGKGVLSVVGGVGGDCVCVCVCFGGGGC